MLSRPKKAEMGDQDTSWGWRGLVVLNRMVSKDVMEKLTSEETPEGGEGVNFADRSTFVKFKGKCRTWQRKSGHQGAVARTLGIFWP